ncbi:MAG: GNAT family N-acetyltransferase [Flavobacteriaceae bacterium]|nr:GNAT family N-acetyltransferase [Flavobacteriaceae bacterium]
MTFIKREQFLWNFMRQGQVCDSFEYLRYNNNILFSNKNKASEFPKVIYISLVPSFLEPIIYHSDDYTLKKITHQNFSGAGIAIEKGMTLELYLNNQLKRQTRINLKRSITRLEESFNISYEYNHGDISKEKCAYLLDTLYNMLKIRFKQKNEHNNRFSHWQEYTKNIYALIQQKKASLFVVYDHEKPISISLNFHFNNHLLMSEVSSYDIDYGKFSLGHLDNYILLQWCMEHEYGFLDLGNGIYDFKEKWCNTFYEVNYLVYYKKKSFLASAMALKEVLIILAKNKVKSWNLTTKLNHLKALAIKKQEDPIRPLLDYTIEEIQTLELMDISQLKSINIHDDLHRYLRKPVYDFIYNNKENINHVSVFQCQNEAKRFLIKGERIIHKIEFKLT